MGKEKNPRRVAENEAMAVSRMLRTSPPNQRTPVYHSIINGYLANARDRGFECAHIWVAPPQAGDEYIFHCRRRRTCLLYTSPSPRD